MEDNKNTQNTETQNEGQENNFDINTVLNHPDFLKAMESHADMRVSAALKKREDKHKSELAEAERKAKMTAEELQRDKESQLAEKERQLAEKMLQLDKLNLFKEKGYSLDFADYITGHDVETIAQKAEQFSKLFNGAVEKAVEERLKGAYKPPQDTKETKTEYSMDSLSQMTEAQIAELWKAGKLK